MKDVKEFHLLKQWARHELGKRCFPFTVPDGGGAAHFDTQVRAETDMLRGWKSGIDGVDRDFVVHYAVAISAAVKDISATVLACGPG
jgi:hypothetical protein